MIAIKVFKFHEKLVKIHCALPLSVVSSALLPFRPRRPRLSVIVAGTTAEPTASRRHCCQYGRLCGLQRGAAATRPRAGAAHWASSWKRPEIQKTPCGYVWGILVCIQNPSIRFRFLCLAAITSLSIVKKGKHFDLFRSFWYFHSFMVLSAFPGLFGYFFCLFSLIWPYQPFCFGIFNPSYMT